MLKNIGVKDIIDIEKINDEETFSYIENTNTPTHLLHRTRTIVIMEDGRIFGTGLRKERFIEDIKKHWVGFNKESNTIREALIDAKMSTELSEYMWIWRLYEEGD
ncbi:hypothetical protein [Peribacillus sp. TH27]|uniref:hypothetical protein n=1 Tax=Peribacillus sp. TH27 TaxID=2798484 RepID=UPI001A91E8B0|nr:hypothetical protein [Peribacillus sp. TH27]